MSITFIASASGVNTASLPAHLPGDLLVVWSTWEGTLVAPNAPAGWVELSRQGAGSGSGNFGVYCGYKFASSSSESVGTFSNSSKLNIAIYRGVNLVGGSASNFLGPATPTYTITTIPQEYSIRNVSGSSRLIFLVGTADDSWGLSTSMPGYSNVLNDVSSGTAFSVFESNSTLTGMQTVSYSPGSSRNTYSACVLMELVPPVEEPASAVYGIKVLDSSGNIRFDSSRSLGRIIGTLDVAAGSSGSFTVAQNYGNATLFAFAVENNVSSHVYSGVPIVSVIGNNTIQWVNGSTYPRPSTIIWGCK